MYGSSTCTYFENKNGGTFCSMFEICLKSRQMLIWGIRGSVILNSEFGSGRTVNYRTDPTGFGSYLTFLYR
jgi:hypothetical protein